eukprot:CAMPEP_0195335818 /NCGR_PEP_ID=MMETSP0708-20121125/15814_1 /TAXON_ID=33640 /ORGANISM="Asterionellopsis glacialis, Strain CCMP134" /LENGTH=137 /DNA_ID=CAMNT_0040406269 /DNA_START=233 /DNA_END=642 /DNA_ORIENTATION=-
MVKVHGQETIFNPQSLVDPKHVHPMKTSPLSIPIPPGTHKLQFQSLDVNTKYPFRLVGISFTDEVSVPLLHEFSPHDLASYSWGDPSLFMDRTPLPLPTSHSKPILSSFPICSRVREGEHDTFPSPPSLFTFLYCAR